MDDCFVCRKQHGLEPVPGGFIYEDDLICAGHCWSPEEGHSPYLAAFIVEPRRHVLSWADLTDGEARMLGAVIRDVSRVQRALLGAEHNYVFVLGHQVPHLHVWVMPRFPGTPREYWGLGLFDWPDRPSGNAAEVEALCARVRLYMEQSAG